MKQREKKVVQQLAQWTETVILGQRPDDVKTTAPECYVNVRRVERSRSNYRASSAVTKHVLNTLARLSHHSDGGVSRGGAVGWNELFAQML